MMRNPVNIGLLTLMTAVLLLLIFGSALVVVVP